MKSVLKDKSNLLIICLVITITLLGTFLYVNLNANAKEKEKDSIIFSNEYKEVPEDNLYVYKTSDEIIEILENGTGIVLLGFPECPWCQKYAIYLNEVAQDMGFEKIYYYNIYEDRKNNSEIYQKIISLLNDYLQYDEEGNKKIYVPSAIVLNKGKIIGFNDETALDTKEFGSPEDYWSEETIQKFKNNMREILININNNLCDDCNK